MASFMQLFIKLNSLLKKNMKLFSLLFAICLFSIQCKKSVLTDPVLTGKLIVNGPCLHYAIQLEKGNIDTANIVASWYNRGNDSTYTNVFTVSNYCTFGNYGLQKGDVFTFQIDSNPSAQNCFNCMIVVAVPPKENAVINVNKIN
jgi:hypothetical protein